MTKTKTLEVHRTFIVNRVGDLDGMSETLYAMATTLRAYGYDNWADSLGDVAWGLATEADDIEMDHKEAS